MLKDFTISNLLDLNETIAAELFEGKTYPWEVLPEIREFIMKLGLTLSPSEQQISTRKLQLNQTIRSFSVPTRFQETKKPCQRLSTNCP